MKKETKYRAHRSAAVLLSAAMVVSPVGAGAVAAEPLPSESKNDLSDEGESKVESENARLADEAVKSDAKIEKTDDGYKMTNDYFTVETGKYGEISSLKITDDEFDTNYVMNAENASAQDTEGHEWLGELMFQTRSANEKAWTKERTQASDSVRNVKLSGNKVIVTYEGSEEENGISRLKVTESYSLVNNKVRWEIKVENATDEELEVGDIGLPMPFNEFWTAGDQIYETRTVDHSFVGQNGSYIYVTRPSGEGKFLLMTPDQDTDAGFEYQDHWRTAEHKDAGETAWCQDQSGWQNGLNVFYIKSAAIKETGRGYLENTSLKLEPGESKTYSFNFQAVEDEADMKSALYEEGLIDAVAVPGMAFAKDMPAKMYLHTKYDPEDLEVEVQCPHDIKLYDGKKNFVSSELEHTADSENTYARYEKTVEINGEKYHIYDLKFDELGQNNVVVSYDGDKKTTLQFYIMDNAADALSTHSEFMVDKTQLDTPGETGDAVFDDWMMDQKTTRNNVESNYFGMSYWGWGDDWGLTHGTFLAEKNVYQPVAKEIKALDKYLDTAIWNGLMQEHHEDYLIHDFLVEEPNPSPTYRGYAYPHIYNTYFMMYKIASRYPDMTDYIETPDTYLMRAYNIMMAYYSDGVAYNWGTGVMGESTTPDIIAALKKEGHSTEAEKVESIMDRKYDSFKAQKYPYGSEYSYDNTGEEAVYVLAKMQKEKGKDTSNAERMMKAINTKTRACRGNQPIWYHYADPVTNCGENWWQFQYSASLIGYCMNDYLLNEDNEYDTADDIAEAERMNYAAKLANLTCINSGQIDSDPENIGAAAWTYQAEMGNLGGQGTGGGKLHNGWRQMTGEADLGLFGALQILSSDVAVDPVFGLFGYGCEVSEEGETYDVTPMDGLYTKLNLVNEKLSIELERDQYTHAVVNKAADGMTLSFKNLEKTEHTSDLSVTGLKKGNYILSVDGKTQGSFSVEDGEKTTVPVKLPAGEKAEVKITFGENENGKVTVSAGEDASTALSDEFYLEGQAVDTGAISETPSVKWEIAEDSENKDAEIENPENLRTLVKFTSEGTYKFKLTAVDSGVSDEITIKVGKDSELAETIAEYTFDDIDGSAVKNTVSGVSATLVGKAEIGEGSGDTKGLIIHGSNKNGYVRLNSGLTKRLDESTAAVDVKLADSQTTGAAAVNFADTLGHSMIIEFVNGNEIALKINGEELKTGISIAKEYWKNIAVTADGEKVTLYVDGEEKFETESSFKFSEFGNVQTDYLGRNTSQTDAFFNGSIDNFGLYSKAFSADEIRERFGSDESVEFVSADGGTVVTEKGKAPVLPDKVTVLYSNGLYETKAAEWDEVSKDSYEKPGEFTVSGKVDGKEASVKVMVVDGVLMNIAPNAEASAIFEDRNDLGGAPTINDGYEPKSSADTSHGTWHNWNGGNQSGSGWVQLTWNEDQIITGCDSYYFRDGNGNFYPASASIYYLDDDGKTWKSVTNVKGLGVELDQYNKTTFDAVKTKALRMEMTPGKLALGVIEWKVYGYGDELTQLKADLNQKNTAMSAIAENSVEEGYTALQEAIEKADIVLKASEVTEDEVKEASEGLDEAFKGIKARGDNLSLIAQVSASYTSSWESLAAVNDGRLPINAHDSYYSHWGTWGNTSSEESITYTWPGKVSFSSSDLYLWYDGSEIRSGGIKFPVSYKYEILDEDGNWKEPGNVSGLGLETDKFSTTTFDKVTTTAIRVTFKKESADGNGVGVHEWQITGTPASEEKTYTVYSKYGASYCKDEEGNAVTGFVSIDGDKYYFDPANRGIMKKASKFTVTDEDGKERTCHALKSGKLATGFVKAWSKLEYYDEEGYLVTDEFITVDGEIYHADAEGRIDKSKFVNYTDSDGNEKTCYMNKDGKMARGLVKSWGRTYYFYEDGHMAKNEDVTVDGKTYHFDEKGYGRAK
ncbi:MAG: Ig-like domain-containing protein [Lachnospiraceae bacterium]|nr:Ig-like domain-containing protein [Lachnospiraceae bacterium]